MFIDGCMVDRITTRRFLAVHFFVPPNAVVPLLDYRCALDLPSLMLTTALPQIFLDEMSFKASGTDSSPLYALSNTTGLILPLSISGASSSQILAFSSGSLLSDSPYL